MTPPLSGRQAVLLVARREFVTQVRSRSFIIGLVITLALFGVGGAVGYFLSARGSEKSLALTSTTAPLRPALVASAAAQGLTLDLRDTDEATGRAQVADGKVDGLLSGGSGGYQLLGRDAVDGRLLAVVTPAVQQYTLSTALVGAGVDPATVAAQAQVTAVTLEPVDPERGQQLGLAIIGTILLFISINYASLVASGVVEEKQSRVVELLLATIKPWQLLAGKVLGLGAVGLLSLLVLGTVGVAVGTATGLLTLPSAALSMFVVVIVWYLLGFFLLASIYAAIGSTVSRQEELQTVLAPMIFVLIIPFILTLNLLPNDPRSPIMAVLSFVPLFAQTVMPARFALGVASWWEVALSALITVAAIAIVVRLAGRVYRNSVLRTGGRVSLREALTSR